MTRMECGWISWNSFCKEYRLRRDLMDAALSKYAPEGMIFERPRGGYYIWCRLPKGVDETALIKAAAEYHVAFLPGRSSHTVPSEDGHIRLNFTFVPKVDIEKGIRLLCRAVKELQELVKDSSGDDLVDLNPIV